MIREASAEDLDKILAIWLATNLEAHEFVEASYWQNQLLQVAQAMDTAEVYVAEDFGFIQGFIGLQGSYIAGLFVAQEFQGQGVGTQLLTFAKEKQSPLTLSIFEKNKKAIAFYEKQGFRVEKREIDAATGEEQFWMTSEAAH
ncbi:GNAT family N-acetyltransferase [Streptococcus sp. NLN76]|uniref:GNAT family N-acetyltransferase n=1 Tax=Streptococcus sp. NLN76 TaxID=2822800 RepID=UPI0018AC2078|nr:GNAT family N-acetyltransferase [Streptococcus sp. NLN76]MBF8970452.1 GNAT family N-acetyltransferase [Streptococcus sp. NLN76]